MRRVRLRVRRQAGAAGANAAARIAVERFARATTRRLLKKVRRRPIPKIDKDVLVARYRPSPILDALVPSRREKWVGILRRPALRKVPALNLRNFNFLDEPAGTLQAIKKIGELEGVALQAFLHFEDDFCRDAGAYLVLAEIWPQMTRIFEGGRMKGPVQRVLNATGWGRHARMSLRAAENDVDFLYEGKHADVWAFPLQRRRRALSSRSATVHLDPQTREEATDRFCAAVDEWIGVPEINQELTDSGKGWIGGIIGELLCNAERHSHSNSDDGDWSTTAFMVRRTEEGQPVLRCYMAFLSVGRSFAESLSDAAPDIIEGLQGYLRKHWASGISAEILTTIYALQDTITCDPVAREDRSGGTGLQDVLEFVEFLAGPSRSSGDTRVTIVSGKACIRLRHPYLKGQRRESGQPRLLWCNQANSSDYPPDASVVDALPEHFAGTLVSVAFTLDPAYLALQVESDDDGDDKP